MFETTHVQARAKVQRREFLCLAPRGFVATAWIGSAPPLTQSGQLRGGIGCTLGPLRRAVRSIIKPAMETAGENEDSASKAKKPTAT